MLKKSIDRKCNVEHRTEIVTGFKGIINIKNELIIQFWNIKIQHSLRSNETWTLGNEGISECGSDRANRITWNWNSKIAIRERQRPNNNQAAAIWQHNVFVGGILLSKTVKPIPATKLPEFEIQLLSRCFIWVIIFYYIYITGQRTHPESSYPWTSSSWSLHSRYSFVLILAFIHTVTFVLLVSSLHYSWSHWVFSYSRGIWNRHW